MNKSFRDAMMEMLMQGQGGRPPAQPLIDQGQFMPGPLAQFPSQDKQSSMGGLDPQMLMQLAQMGMSAMGSGY